MRTLGVVVVDAVTDEKVVALVGPTAGTRFTHPTRISSKGCQNLTDESIMIIAVATRCPHLVQLQMGGGDDDACRNLTDQSIIAVAIDCPELARLDVAGCVCMSDKSTIAIANRCPHLAELNINNCFEVTEKAQSPIALWQGAERSRERRRPAPLNHAFARGGGADRQYGGIHRPARTCHHHHGPRPRPRPRPRPCCL